MQLNRVYTKMITIEIQHFHGCPNSDEMIKNVKEAIKQSKTEITYKETLVDTPAKARLYKFRGSPTLLLNGIDLEGFPEPDLGNLACRYYKNGIPSVEELRNKIQQYAKREVEHE